MLKKIRLKNFKLHEDTSIEASRITVFIGPNNSGKSSIFQALLALKQAGRPSSSDVLVPLHQREATSPEQPFLYTEPRDLIVDLGEFREVLRDPTQELQIGADVELPPEANFPALAMGALQLSFDVWFGENRMVRHGGSFACAYGQAGPWTWHRSNGTPASVRLQIPQYGGELSVNLGERIDSLVQCGVVFKQPPLDRDISAMTSALNRSVNVWSRFLDSLRLVHHQRGFEEWGYPITNFPGQESLDRLVLSDRSVALTNMLAANARLRTQISDLLKSLVEIGIEFETASSYRVRIWATAAKTGKAETLFVNEGSGANQLPFILVPIALAQPDETVLLAEPEAHLHPKMQSELTGTILRASKERKLQFFIETHSEHVLHRLLHAVAKGDLARDDLAIHYFVNKDGKAEVRQLEVDEKGGVQGGLPGFFDQSLDELTEYLDALKQPKA